jgi:DNA polymerase-3 subunit alpha
MDFSADKREKMFEYAVTKYGIGRCALVSTFGMRKAKASLRDTARVFNIDPEIADEAAKLIPEVFYDDDGEKTIDLSIEDSIKIVPRLAELYEEAENPLSQSLSAAYINRGRERSCLTINLSGVSAGRYSPARSQLSIRISLCLRITLPIILRCGTNP